MNEGTEAKLSPGREQLARKIIGRVGEPVDLKDKEKMTRDEAALVAQFLLGVVRPRAEFVVDMCRGEISGDVGPFINETEEE